jgi:hypothetical protein
MASKPNQRTSAIGAATIGTAVALITYLGRIGDAVIRDVRSS